MFDYSSFKEDTQHEGAVLCWVCTNLKDDNVVGIFHTQLEAESLLETLGDGHEVYQGSYWPASGHFDGLKRLTAN